MVRPLLDEESARLDRVVELMRRTSRELAHCPAFSGTERVARCKEVPRMGAALIRREAEPFVDQLRVRAQMSLERFDGDLSVAARVVALLQQTDDRDVATLPKVDRQAAESFDCARIAHEFQLTSGT
jgi:hypothetical protein